jgi:signal transduction histidine kinase
MEITMKIKQKFHLYNFILFAVPIAIIGIVSVLFLIIFIAKFPADELYISRASLINPSMLIQAIGSFFSHNPSAITYVAVYAFICISVCVVCGTLSTRRLADSLEKPVYRLRCDIDRIRNGELNFEVMGSEYEELNDLCEGFDSMRRALIMSREREKKLKHERDMLIANISHDIKTPITSIKGYIDGINDGVADTPEKLARYLGTIKQKAETIDSLVSNLSEFAKLEVDGPEFNMSVGDLRDLALDVLDSYRIDFERCSIELDADLGQIPLPVNIDGDKMRRVITNIIDNALKYRRKSSKTLIVRAFTDEGNAYLTICDDGIGIPQKEIKHVFDSFYRSDLSRSSHIKGNGLGLSIAKQITERHHGRLWLRSDGTNKGTTVTICLPLAQQSK